MNTILAIDLGKFKSVACTLDTQSKETAYRTIDTNPEALKQLLRHAGPSFVVIEACSVAGWVADLCREEGVEVQVANTMHEAWSWRKVKRKTDKDDALKLAKLAALGELPTVHMPGPAQRQHKALVAYRTKLVGRRTAIQNNIRSLFQSQGLQLPAGHRAWTKAGLETLASWATPLEECGALELWRGELDLELHTLEGVMRQLDDVDSKLGELAEEDDRVRLLQTIPGVGRCTAEVVVTIIDDPHRFDSGPGLGLCGAGASAVPIGHDGPQGADHPPRPGPAAEDAGGGSLGDATVQPLGGPTAGPDQPRSGHPAQAGVGGGGVEAPGVLLGDAAGQPPVGSAPGRLHNTDVATAHFRMFALEHT